MGGGEAKNCVFFGLISAPPFSSKTWVLPAMTRTALGKIKAAGRDHSALFIFFLFEFIWTYAAKTTKVKFSLELTSLGLRPL
jgi:hypothetical protein